MTPTSIQTIHGNWIDLLNPTVDQIHWEDIVWALPTIPRFTGHLSYPYNVADHCINGAAQISEEYRLYFLLHDASEAYTGDISRPLKVGVPEFKDRIETPLMNCIFEKAGLDPQIPDEVKIVDDRMLLTERRDLHPLGIWEEYHPLTPDHKPYDFKIYPRDHWVSRVIYNEMLEKELKK